MNSPVLYALARFLIASVFVGIGAERLLTAFGWLGAEGTTTFSNGALGFSAFEVIAGLCIMAGYQVRWIALLMAIFLLVDAFAAHSFWKFPATERHEQLLHFLKNLSCVGGLLLLSGVAGAKAVKTWERR